MDVVRSGQNDIMAKIFTAGPRNTFTRGLQDENTESSFTLRLSCMGNLNVTMLIKAREASPPL